MKWNEKNVKAKAYDYIKHPTRASSEMTTSTQNNSKTIQFGWLFLIWQNDGFKILWILLWILSTIEFHWAERRHTNTHTQKRIPDFWSFLTPLQNLFQSSMDLKEQQNLTKDTQKEKSSSKFLSLNFFWKKKYENKRNEL